MPNQKIRPAEERFWAKVDKTESCWLWMAGKNNRGYGTFRSGPVQGLAHRFAYELLVGPIGEGMVVDHTCHNRGCVNPSHLRTATQSQNLQNRTGPQSNSKSGVRGVSPTPSGKWMATAVVRRKHHYAGTFTTIAEAEAAVVALRNKLFTHNDKDRKAA